MVKSIVLAAAAVLTLSIGSAFANEGQGALPNTRFTEIPGVLTRPPRYLHAVPVSKADKSVWYYAQDLEQYTFPPHYTHLYGARVSGGTWLFPADPNQGDG